MLEHRGTLAGARVLDLFAGSGGLGIEALSRGAASLVAVEQARLVARVLVANLEECGFSDRAEVLVLPVASAGARLRARGPFDLVLIDPPYRSGAMRDALHIVVAAGILGEDALVVAETSRGEDLDEIPGLVRVTARPCGDSQITLLRAEERVVSREVTVDAEH
jgi:16S rRNA (guanine966-N2)-methyltransferase